MNQLMSAPEVSYSDTEIDCSPSPGQQTQVVLPVREFPRFVGTKKDDVVTFIQQVDEIAASACWSDREWVLNVADLVGGFVAPLGRWIQKGLSATQDLMEA